MTTAYLERPAQVGRRPKTEYRETPLGLWLEQSVASHGLNLPKLQDRGAGDTGFLSNIIRGQKGAGIDIIIRIARALATNEDGEVDEDDASQLADEGLVAAGFAPTGRYLKVSKVGEERSPYGVTVEPLLEGIEAAQHMGVWDEQMMKRVLNTLKSETALAAESRGVATDKSSDNPNDET